MHQFNDDLDGSLRLTGSQYGYRIGYDKLLTQAFDINYDILQEAGYNPSYTRQIEDQMKQAQAELGPSIDNYNKK